MRFFKDIYEGLFYSLYVRRVNFNSNPEAFTLIYFSFILSLNFYLCLCCINISNIEEETIAQYFFTIVLIYNFLYFERKQYYKIVVERFKKGNQTKFSVFGILYPILSLTIVLFLINAGFWFILGVIICFLVTDQITSFFKKGD